MAFIQLNSLQTIDIIVEKNKIVFSTKEILIEKSSEIFICNLEEFKANYPQYENINLDRFYGKFNLYKIYGGTYINNYKPEIS